MTLQVSYTKLHLQFYDITSVIYEITFVILWQCKCYLQSFMCNVMTLQV